MAKKNAGEEKSASDAAADAANAAKDAMLSSVNTLTKMPSFGEDKGGGYTMGVSAVLSSAQLLTVRALLSFYCIVVALVGLARFNDLSGCFYVTQWMSILVAFYFVLAAYNTSRAMAVSDDPTSLTYSKRWTGRAKLAIIAYVAALSFSSVVVAGLLGGQVSGLPVDAAKPPGQSDVVLEILYANYYAVLPLLLLLDLWVTMLNIHTSHMVFGIMGLVLFSIMNGIYLTSSPNYSTRTATTPVLLHPVDFAMDFRTARCWLELLAGVAIVVVTQLFAKLLVRLRSRWLYGRLSSVARGASSNSYTQWKIASWVDPEGLWANSGLLPDNTEDDEAREAAEIEDALDFFEIRMTSANWVVLLALILYMLLGVAIDLVAFPTWDWVRALYFTVVSLSTVGYGDFFPESNWHKVVNSIYLVFGLSIIAAITGSITGRILSFHDTLGEKLSAQHGGICNCTPEFLIMMLYQAGFYAVFAAGVVFYQFNEPSVDWYDAIAHITTTLTTVGYGDTSPSLRSSRVFSIFYIFFGTAYCAGAFASIIAWMIRLERNSKFKRMKAHPEALSNAIRTGVDTELGTQKHISSETFVMMGLVHLGNVTADELQELDELYDNHVCPEE